MNPLELNSKKIANIWRIKRDGIIAIKFETAQIHFLSDAFLAVAVAFAVLFLKRPISKRLTGVSLVTIPGASAKVNSPQFPRFLWDELKLGR